MTNEAVSISKAAIAVLLTCLLLGATLFLFYRLYIPSNQAMDNMIKTENSSKIERLYELEDLSGAGDYPLVSNVVSCLSEFDGTDLLYIHVADLAGSENHLYTYTGLNNSIFGDYSAILETSDSPPIAASRFLQRFTDKRCSFSINRVDYNATAGNLLGLEVLIR